MQTSSISTEVATKQEQELLDKTPSELLQYLLAGGQVIDTPQLADRLIDILIPKSAYSEIVVLGNEYCFRTKDRKCELLRVPRGVAGLILITANSVRLHEQVLVYYATGGKGL